MESRFAKIKSFLNVLCKAHQGATVCSYPISVLPSPVTQEGDGRGQLTVRTCPSETLSP